VLYGYGEFPSPKTFVCHSTRSSFPPHQTCPVARNLPVPFLVAIVVVPGGAAAAIACFDPPRSALAAESVAVVDALGQIRTWMATKLLAVQERRQHSMT
jgi:hypothetical protein